MAMDLATGKIRVDSEGKIHYDRSITIVNTDDFRLRVGRLNHEGLGDYTGFQMDWRW